MTIKNAKNILDFWFNESLPEELFRQKNSFDKKIKDRFFNDYEKAIINEYDEWQDDPKSCLALIILLDQFSRNLFRNNKKAFGPSWAAQVLNCSFGYLLKLLCIDDLTKIFNSVCIITGGSRCYSSGLLFIAWILANFNSLWNQ